MLSYVSTHVDEKTNVEANITRIPENEYRLNEKLALTIRAEKDGYNVEYTLFATIEQVNDLIKQIESKMQQVGIQQKVSHPEQEELPF